MRCPRNVLRRVLSLGVLSLLLLCAAPASGDVSVSFSPAAPRVGDYIDLAVTADNETFRGVRYRLFLDGEMIYSGRKPVNRLTASFRPRREGAWTLEAAVSLSGNRTDTVSVIIPVAGAAPVQQGADVIYSQRDGWWRHHLYTGSYNHSLETSGCVIFALSHALQRMGMISEDALPDRLARAYGGYYSEGLGARTEALITQAGVRFGFETAHTLIRTEDEAIASLQQGDLFCMGIVQRHVVLADGINSKSRKVHIVDSCPDTTFSRLGRTPAYTLTEDGSWQIIRSADDIPGVRWFFETGYCGGAEYWLDLDFCVSRGLRLIRRP